jgi:hypothetical protein
MGNKPSVYLWKGHAIDLCDGSNNLMLEDVPPGSIVVQSGQCGFLNFINLGGVHLTMSENEPVFFNPMKNQKQIEELLRIDEVPVISLHTAGDPHKLVMSVVYLYNFSKRIDGIWKLPSAGVQRIEGKDDNTIEQFHDFNLGDLPITLFESTYRKSVFPTEETIQTHLTHKFGKPTMTEDDLQSLKYDEIFTTRFTQIIKRFPGIHYNLLCRRPPNPNCGKSTQMRRLESRSRLSEISPSLERLVQLYIFYRNRPHLALHTEMNHLSNTEFKFLFERLVEDETARSCNKHDSDLISISDPRMGLVQIVMKMVRQSQNPKELEPEYKKAISMCFPRMTQEGIDKQWDMLIGQVLSGGKRKNTRRRRRSRRAKSYNS